jgi:hypothetical protein
MIEGTLIAESIRAGAELDGVYLITRKTRRAPQGDVSAGQPELWTLIEFEAEEPAAEALAEALAKVLDQQHGWLGAAPFGHREAWLAGQSYLAS